MGLLYGLADYTWEGMNVSRVTLNEGLWGHDTPDRDEHMVLEGLESTILHVDIVHSVSSQFTIPGFLFEGCTNLTSVDGIDPVTKSGTGLEDCSYVGEFAFAGTKIGWGLYGKSEELADIEYIGPAAFMSAHLGESCNASEQGGQDSDRGLWVDRNCVQMGADAFAYNPNLKWIGLPGPSHDISDISEMDQSRRLSIDNGQFSDCSGLSNIINLEFQKSFSTNAIVGCNSLPFLNLFYVDEVVDCNNQDMENVPVSYIHIGPELASQLSAMIPLFAGCS